MLTMIMIQIWRYPHNSCAGATECNNEYSRTDDDNSNENNVKDQHHKQAKPGHKRELVLNQSSFDQKKEYN
jgi:hypothetical protein